MRLKASCAMTVRAPHDCPVVAMLRPRSGQAQWMVSERYELTPWVPGTEYVDTTATCASASRSRPARSPSRSRW